MCGIVGYIGTDNAAIILERFLKSLEYRGYDSAGIAVYDNIKGQLNIKKTIGTINNLSEEITKNLKGSLGISHTRWATHGKITKENAHPQTSSNNKITIVHNGIVENYLDLKANMIAKGYTFTSETDSEIIANLIDSHLDKNDINEALKIVLSEITGSSTIVGISSEDPNSIFVVKKGNSGGLVISENEKGEKIISSDPSIISDFSTSYRYLVDSEIAIVSSNSIDFVQEVSKPESRRINITKNTIINDDSVYQFKMEEEIFSQKKALEGLISKKNSLIFKKLDNSKIEFKKVERILIIGMGSSFHAGLLGSSYFEAVSSIKSETINASEFIETKKVIGPEDLVIGVTQSGETAETIKGLEFAKIKGAQTIAVVEKDASQASIISDTTINISSGPEFAVASTKTFTSSVVSLLLMSIKIAEKRNTEIKNLKELLKNIDMLSSKVGSILSDISSIKSLSRKLHNQEHILYLGRGLLYPIALEGALKMKEVCYIHAEAYAAGEMKHGVNALIGDNMPSIVLAPKGSTHAKMLSTVNEITAREGRVIGLVSKKDLEITPLLSEHLTIESYHPLVDPILFVLPLQLISLYCSLRLKINPDRPRNLAKTVTVE
ncbi:MAG: glutamine--fructose-6-phosphate transaminase (isomerizing) [Dehalococcoidia bacterium]|nr:glutamine--fructose-6-phosphate transaminase (isomerizing) [Dehalococcoidia bacterium]